MVPCPCYSKTSESNISMHAGGSADNVRICNLPTVTCRISCGVQKSKTAFYTVKIPVRRSYSCFFALAGSLFVLSRETGNASAKSNAEWIVIPNQPVGTAKGIFPGRVAWVHDPAVATWDGNNRQLVG